MSKLEPRAEFITEHSLFPWALTLVVTVVCGAIIWLVGY